jgi:hypothetical protein
MNKQEAIKLFDKYQELTEESLMYEIEYSLVFENSNPTGYVMAFNRCKRKSILCKYDPKQFDDDEIEFTIIKKIDDGYGDTKPFNADVLDMAWEEHVLYEYGELSKKERKKCESIAGIIFNIFTTKAEAEMVLEPEEILPIFNHNGFPKMSSACGSTITYYVEAFLLEFYFLHLLIPSKRSKRKYWTITLLDKDYFDPDFPDEHKYYIQTGEEKIEIRTANTQLVAAMCDFTMEIAVTPENFEKENYSFLMGFTDNNESLNTENHWNLFKKQVKKILEFEISDDAKPGFIIKPNKILYTEDV